MLTKLLLSARLLLVIPVVGLLGASLALFAKGLRLVFERLDDALLTSTIGEDLYAGGGMALVTLALLAFKYWGGESPHHRPPSSSRITTRGQGSKEARSGGVETFSAS